ncbi:MAG: putative fructoselysine utilization operon transcriptional repressor [Verrucomicrobiae bacterium]|nr:putative fructoselysine utilization operon transcriptional repressor [Verrucomicrobiae bacterium]
MIIGYNQLKTPAYCRAAAKLRDQILSGRRPCGQQLPAERVLCRQLQVSRITIRHALQLLTHEGLIQRRHGSGTYVAPNPGRRIPLMIDYTGSIRSHAPQLRRTVVVARQEPAGEPRSTLLQVAPADLVLYAERVDKLAGTPVAWDQATIAAAFTGRLTRPDLAHVDFIEIWMKRGRFQIRHCEQTVEAMATTAEIAERLDWPVGQPVLRSTEVYYATTNQPAGLFVSYYHPEHICIRSKFRWEEASA